MAESYDIEKALFEMAKSLPKGFRKNELNDVFKIRNYIGPEDLKIDNYLRREPLASFNAGVAEKDGKVYIFPRLIFDYYNYTSSIGVFSLSIEELLDGKWKVPLKTKIILWPQFSWEFLGCEDPRVCVVEDEFYVLYTGKGGYRKNEKIKRRDVLAFARTDSSFDVKAKSFFRVKTKEGYFIPEFMKDSAFISGNNEEFAMLVRPKFKNLSACWYANANLESMTLTVEKMKPVMIPEEWEEKIGWSTNVVKISKHKYLVGWHAVVKEDLSYKNGLAMIDEKGDLLAISNYLLVPMGVNEEYGDRAQVIFGDGLIIHDDLLIWIGGISDYAIGIFVANLNDVMGTLKYL